MKPLFTPINTLAAVGFSALLLVACGDSSRVDTVPTPGTPAPAPTPTPGPAPAPMPSATPKVRFIAFGDAGRASDTQQAVADAMTQFCKLKVCDFAIETGDNFYDAGVASTADEQWQTKFEVPYKDMKFPFYATLGNHDNSAGTFADAGLGEGSDNSRGNIQVAYTTLAGTSGRWKLPKRYHSFTAPLAAGAAPIVEFFCLDSSPLAATSPVQTDTDYNFLTYGPTQMQWFQTGLVNTKAKWTISYAHHPYVSNGTHGNAGTFEGLPATPVAVNTANGKPWQDLVEGSACAEGLDLYLNGHDHLVEWYKPVAACNAKTEFILTGAGSDVRGYDDQARNPTFFQQADTRGFVWFEVTDKTLTGEVYMLEDDKLALDASGQPKPAFVRTITKP